MSKSLKKVTTLKCGKCSYKWNVEHIVTETVVGYCPSCGGKEKKVFDIFRYLPKDQQDKIVRKRRIQTEKDAKVKAAKAAKAKRKEIEEAKAKVQEEAMIEAKPESEKTEKNDLKEETIKLI